MPSLDQLDRRLSRIEGRLAQDARIARQEMLAACDVVKESLPDKQHLAVMVEANIRQAFETRWGKKG